MVLGSKIFSIREKNVKNQSKNSVILILNGKYQYELRMYSIFLKIVS